MSAPHGTTDSNKQCKWLSTGGEQWQWLPPTCFQSQQTPPHDLLHSAAIRRSYTLSTRLLWQFHDMTFVKRHMSTYWGTGAQCVVMTTEQLQQQQQQQAVRLTGSVCHVSAECTDSVTFYQPIIPLHAGLWLTSGLLGPSTGHLGATITHRHSHRQADSQTDRQTGAVDTIHTSQSSAGLIAASCHQLSYGYLPLPSTK